MSVFSGLLKYTLGVGSSVSVVLTGAVEKSCSEISVSSSGVSKYVELVGFSYVDVSVERAVRLFRLNFKDGFGCSVFDFYDDGLGVSYVESKFGIRHLSVARVVFSCQRLVVKEKNALVFSKIDDFLNYCQLLIGVSMLLFACDCCGNKVSERVVLGWLQNSCVVRVVHRNWSVCN